jgi:hypothetical protein
MALRRALKAGVTLRGLLDAMISATTPPAEGLPVEAPPTPLWTRLLSLTLASLPRRARSSRWASASLARTA